MKLSDYEHKLLAGWDEVLKKGQLTLWIMIALYEGPKHMAEIKSYINAVTNGTLSADDKSMYRALRRYNDAEMIGFTNEPGDNGPDRKVYQLTDTGKAVLSGFVSRNIVPVFYKPMVKELFLSLGKGE